MTIKQLAREYTHFLIQPDAGGWTQVFTIDNCEVCGCEVLAPNGCGVSVPPVTCRAAGMQPRLSFPIEGGWSELHEAATCVDCCYDEDAMARAAS